METVILTGLIISGFISSQQNNTIKKNKYIEPLNNNLSKENIINNKNNKNNKNNLSKENIINNKNNLSEDNIINNGINNNKNIKTLQENNKNDILKKEPNKLQEYNNLVQYNSVDNLYNLDNNNNNSDNNNNNNSNNKLHKSQPTGENLQFTHNNMVHFYGGSVKQNTDTNKKHRRLDIFTGGEDLKKSKKETGQLFELEKQNIHGGQNYTEEYKNNINQSRYQNHNLPFEQVKVGPGVGLDFGDGPSGGFHQDIREYEMPKNVDELRAKNNPKITYNGRIIKGKKEIKRDSDYNFTKDKNNVMEVDRIQHPTHGVGKETTRSKVYISDNNRKISKELMGPAGNTIIKESNRQKHRPSDKLKLDVDTTRNIAGDTRYDYDRDAFNCMETKREEQAVQQYEKGLYIANLLKALIPTAQFQDQAKMTIKETTENNKQLLNLKGKEKIMMYNKEPARKTIRETTENNVKDIINIKLYNKLPERIKQKIRTTLKETLLDNNHSGFLGMDEKKTTLRNLEKLKTTLKETLLRDSELLNMIAGYKSKKHFDDKAKLTHKETYTQNYVVGQASENRNDGYKSATYDMVETNKENTCNNDYTGIANREDSTGYMTNKYDAKETNKESYADKDYYGTSIGNKEMMSYEDMYNATINELKEKTLKGRAPTKEGAKTNTSADDINLEIKCDLLRKTQEPQQKTLINNVMLDKNSIVSTSNKNNAINDIIKYNESNNLDDLTQQLNNNPYAISIV